MPSNLFGSSQSNFEIPPQNPGESEEAYAMRVAALMKKKPGSKPGMSSPVATAAGPMAGLMGGGGQSNEIQPYIDDNTGDPFNPDPYGTEPGADIPTNPPGPTPPGPVPDATPTPGYDFAADLRELYKDMEDPTAIDDLLAAYQTDTKWKMPTNQKAKRAMTLAKAFQKMGMGDDVVTQMVSQAFEQGYYTSPWSLSMFSRLLQPYGLGVSGGSSGGSSSSSSSADALLKQLGLA
jgi:hypothetical protein